MKNIDELREKLAEMEMYDTILIGSEGGPDCTPAVVGFTDKQVIYCFDLLVKCFVDWGLEENEAREYVDFNICNTHLGEYEPIIMYQFN